MKWLQGLVPLGVALGLAWVLGGAGSCAEQPALELVSVLDMAPREVELGDTVAILGAGFPAGRSARVTFRGTLHRPGERAIEGAEIVTTGAVVGQDRVDVAFGEASESSFCGAGDRAAHTTFEGTVEVAFAAAVQGASPVAGVLSGVTLDVRPSASAADFEREREGARFVDWMGIRTAPAARADMGVSVAEVEPGSRAEAAGIVPGETIVRFEGTRVATPGDILPSPGENEATVAVRSPGSDTEETRVVAIGGFQSTPPAELLGCGLAILGALAAVLLFGAPLGPLGSALHRASVRVAFRMATTSGPRGTLWARLRLAASGAAKEAFPSAGAPATVDAGAGALLALMPFGQYIVAAQIDVAVLFVAAVAALVATALSSSRRTWGAGLRAAAHVLWQHVPGALAVASVVVTTGSLRIQEIERAQGGSPWDWLAFRSPSSLLAFALLLACALIEPDEAPRPAGLDALVLAPFVEPPGRSRWSAAGCRAHRVIVAGLACALFLGGWRLPGLSPAEQDTRPLLELLGAGCLLAKTWALVLALSWARWSAPQPFLAERTKGAAVLLLPLSVVALGGAAAWTWWSPSHVTQLVVSGSLVTLVGLGAAAMAGHLRRALACHEDAHLSAFL